MMKAARERLGLSLAVTTVPAPVAIWCNMCDVPVSYVQQILHRERARERGRERERERERATRLGTLRKKCNISRRSRPVRPTFLRGHVVYKV